MIYDLRDRRVFVAGHRGMVGSAICRRLASEGCELLTADRHRLDLRRQGDVEDWFAEYRPHAVFLAAATVGGILANMQRPGDFAYDNLAIECAVIEAARRFNVEKLLFLGSACIYPKLAANPIGEDALLTGPLESSNEWYAMAKLAGLKLCQAYRIQYGRDFIATMPTNVYGPHDNFDLVSSHVLAALLRKIHEARQSGAKDMTIWGSGRPRREFLYVDDLADACVFLMKNYTGNTALNAGCGDDVSIVELARLISRIVGFEGGFVFDDTKPDGVSERRLDVRQLTELGWTRKVELEAGIRLTYDWYRANPVALG